jgi:hypothetical protein
MARYGRRRMIKVVSLAHWMERLVKIWFPRSAKVRREVHVFLRSFRTSTTSELETKLDRQAKTDDYCESSPMLIRGRNEITISSQVGS